MVGGGQALFVKIVEFEIPVGIIKNASSSRNRNAGTPAPYISSHARECGTRSVGMAVPVIDLVGDRLAQSTQACPSTTTTVFLSNRSIVKVYFGIASSCAQDVNARIVESRHGLDVACTLRVPFKVNASVSQFSIVEQRI